jgi:hypothetical protein
MYLCMIGPSCQRLPSTLYGPSSTFARYVSEFDFQYPTPEVAERPNSVYSLDISAVGS